MHIKPLRSGDLAYVDSFAGLIPCKVISITGNSGRCGSDQSVTVKLTANRGAYKRGQTLVEWGWHIIPRYAVMKNGYQFRILPYDVEADSK